MKHLRTISKWVLPSVKIAYKLLATSAEVFCRHSFGQRYAPRLVVSCLFCLLVSGLSGMVFASSMPQLFDIYVIVLLVLLAYHLANMLQPAAPRHSYSSGQSWGVWRHSSLNSNVVKLLGEPLLHVFFGFLVAHLCMPLSLWLLLAGISLFIKECQFQLNERSRILDAMDARFEGERISTGVRHRTAPQQGGEQRAATVVPADQTQTPSGSIARIQARLDPALQRLLSPTNQNRRIAPTVRRPPDPPGTTR